jgi:hypothetical protein
MAAMWYSAIMVFWGGGALLTSVSYGRQGHLPSCRPIYLFRHGGEAPAALYMVLAGAGETIALWWESFPLPLLVQVCSGTGLRHCGQARHHQSNVQEPMGYVMPVSVTPLALPR